MGSIWLTLGATITLLLAACQGEVATPAANPSRADLTQGEAGQQQEYRELVNLLMDGTGQIARIISGISISLAGRPEDAAEEKDAVDGAIGSLKLARERLQEAGPPRGYEGLHQTLLDALSFYIQASGALLPDSQTGEADYPRFQELMQQGGKNFHEAGAKLSDLALPQD